MTVSVLLPVGFFVECFDDVFDGLPFRLLFTLPFRLLSDLIGCAFFFLALLRVLLLVDEVIWSCGSSVDIALASFFPGELVGDYSWEASTADSFEPRGICGVTEGWAGSSRWRLLPSLAP